MSQVSAFVSAQQRLLELELEGERKSDEETRSSSNLGGLELDQTSIGMVSSVLRIVLRTAVTQSTVDDTQIIRMQIIRTRLCTHIITIYDYDKSNSPLNLPLNSPLNSPLNAPRTPCPVRKTSSDPLVRQL